jgi:hypothetical protein
MFGPVRITPAGFAARACVGVVASILIPPFVILAIAPMLLFMVPVALVAIPFMLATFAGEAKEVGATPKRVPALRHAMN